LQRMLQRHPTMQGCMLLRAYKWSNPRILRFRSAVGADRDLRKTIQKFLVRDNYHDRSLHGNDLYPAVADRDALL
jgi:hypothetical protein